MADEGKFFKLDFHEPGEPGDEWQCHLLPSATCAVCGRRPLPYGSRFRVPDDDVLRVDGGFWGFRDHPLLECTGIVLAREDIAEALAQSGLTGFEFRDALVSRLDDEPKDRPLPTYRWLVVTGRCEVTPIWERAVGSCDACGAQLTERVNRTTRSWALQKIYPPEPDVCRAREGIAGVIVSNRFRALLIRLDPRVTEALTFKPVAVGGPAGGT